MGNLLGPQKFVARPTQDWSLFLSIHRFQSPRFLDGASISGKLIWHPPPPPIEVNEVSELAGIEVGGCGKLTHLGLIAARRPLYFWTDTIPTVVYRRKTQYIYTIASSKNRCKGSKKAKIRSWMTTFEKEKQFQDFWILLVDAPPPRKNGTNLPSNSWNTHILCYNGGKKPPLRIKD